MKKLIFAIAAVAVMGFPAVVNAAACRNAQGQFIKCVGSSAAASHAPSATSSRAATTPHAAIVAHPVAIHTAVATSARRAPCRDAHGRFKKC